MWRLSDAELYCVNMKMRISPELMQLETGMSMSLYLPPSGTAGFARSFVRGASRCPAPPPRITANTSFISIMRSSREQSYFFAAQYEAQEYNRPSTQCSTRAGNHHRLSPVGWANYLIKQVSCTVRR